MNETERYLTLTLNPLLTEKGFTVEEGRALTTLEYRSKLKTLYKKILADPESMKAEARRVLAELGEHEFYQFCSSTMAEPYCKYHRQKCKVLRKLDKTEADEEAGVMYKVKFLDGTVLDVFADELN